MTLTLKFKRRAERSPAWEVKLDNTLNTSRSELIENETGLLGRESVLVNCAASGVVPTVQAFSRQQFAFTTIETISIMTAAERQGMECSPPCNSVEVEEAVPTYASRSLASCSLASWIQGWITLSLNRRSSARARLGLGRPRWHWLVLLFTSQPIRHVPLPVSSHSVLLVRLTIPFCRKQYAPPVPFNTSSAVLYYYYSRSYRRLLLGRLSDLE